MKSAVWTRIYSLFLPFSLLALTALAPQAFQDGWPKGFQDFLRYYPGVVFALGIVLGVLFHRSRVAMAVLVLALADRALIYYGSVGREQAQAVFEMLAVLVPLNLAVFCWTPERGLFSFAGLRRLAAIGLQAAAVLGMIYFGKTDLLVVLQKKIIELPFLSERSLHQPSLVVFTAALVAILFRFITRPRAIESGFLGALVAVFLALQAENHLRMGTLYFAGAGLILLAALNATSYSLAFRDALTGLPARRALDETLPTLGRRYAIAVADIDHFKKINDTYGHDVGDQVLRMVAKRLGQTSGGGKAFRSGGEEFVILFRGKNTEQVLPHLEKVREAIENSTFTLRAADRPKKKPKKPYPASSSHKQIKVTISIGVAASDGSQGNPREVMDLADKALYKAKRSGRNRVKTV